MNQNPKQIIIDVLNAIGYEDDKDKFANDFLSICLLEAVARLTKEIPQDKQDQLIQRMSLVGPDKVEALLLEYFSKEQVEEAIQSATSSAFESYLNTITGSLDQEQKTKLEQHLSSLN